MTILEQAKKLKEILDSNKRAYCEGKDVAPFLNALIEAYGIIEWIGAHEKDAPGLADAMNEKARDFLTKHGVWNE